MSAYVLQAYLFEEVGITRVAVTVKNDCGRLDKNITLVSSLLI